MPEDVSFPGFRHQLSSAPPTRQQEPRHSRILLHTFIQSCFFFLYISPVYISPLFISPLFLSPLFISPLFLYLPRLYLPIITILSRIIILPLTRASHSYILSALIHSQQATSPHQACSFSQSGRQGHASTKYGLVYTASIMVHLHSSHDGPGLFSGV